MATKRLPFFFSNRTWFFCDAAAAARHGGVPATALTGPQFANLRSLAGSLHSPQLEGRWTSPSSHQRSVGRSTSLSGLVFLFCVVDRPGVLFLGFLAPWFVFMAGLMERFFHLRFWYVVLLHLVFVFVWFFRVFFRVYFLVEGEWK